VSPVAAQIDSSGTADSPEVAEPAYSRSLQATLSYFSVVLISEYVSSHAAGWLPLVAARPIAT
jgi:hypothetical protein